MEFKYSYGFQVDGQLHAQRIHDLGKNLMSRYREEQLSLGNSQVAFICHRVVSTHEPVKFKRGKYNFRTFSFLISPCSVATFVISCSRLGLLAKLLPMHSVLVKMMVTPECWENI